MVFFINEGLGFVRLYDCEIVDVGLGNGLLNFKVYKVNCWGKWVVSFIYSSFL